MTPSELKAQVESRGIESHFFDRETMKFFGDSMKNYGLRRVTIESEFSQDGKYVKGGTTRDCWELYRKRPVKRGNRSSAFFDAVTFNQVYEIKPWVKAAYLAATAEPGQTN